MKEILGQEYDFKTKLAEETAQRESEMAIQKAELEKAEFIAQKEQEFQSLLINEKAKVHHSKAKDHADQTQQLYDEIYQTLKQKFQLESKMKIQEVSKEMKKALEDNVGELQKSHEAEVNRLNQKNTSLQLQITLKDKDIESLNQSIESQKKQTAEEKEKSDLSF